MSQEATMSKLGGGVDQLEGDLLQSNTLGVDEQRLHKTKHLRYKYTHIFSEDGQNNERKGKGCLEDPIY